MTTFATPIDKIALASIRRVIGLGAIALRVIAVFATALALGACTTAPQEFRTRAPNPDESILFADGVIFGDSIRNNFAVAIDDQGNFLFARNTRVDPRLAYRDLLDRADVAAIEIWPGYYGVGDIVRIQFNSGAADGEVYCAATFPPLFVDDSAQCPSMRDRDALPKNGYDACGWGVFVSPADSCQYSPYGAPQPAGYVPCYFDEFVFYVPETEYCPRASEQQRPPAGFDLCYPIDETGDLKGDVAYYYPAEYKCIPMETAPRAIMGPTDDRVAFADAAPLEQEAARATAMLVRERLIVPVGETRDVRLLENPSAPQLCEEERFARYPKSGECSAVKIGDRLVATAAHCVRTERQCQRMRVVFGFHAVSEAAGEQSTIIPAENVYRCERVVDYQQPDIGKRGADWAILELDRDIDAPSVTLSELTGGSGDGRGEYVTIIGHPMGLPTIVTRASPVKWLASEYFVTEADTFIGNSGSPAFIETALREGRLEIAGILARGEHDFNDAVDEEHACLTVRHCPENVCHGEDVTLADLLKETVAE